MSTYLYHLLRSNDMTTTHVKTKTMETKHIGEAINHLIGVRLAFYCVSPAVHTQAQTNKKNISEIEVNIQKKLENCKNIDYMDSPFNDQMCDGNDVAV